MTPSPEHLELAAARARIAELEAALRQWYETQLNQPWPIGHGGHVRGVPKDHCDACRAEIALSKLALALPVTRGRRSAN